MNTTPFYTRLRSVFRPFSWSKGIRAESIVSFVGLLSCRLIIPSLKMNWPVCTSSICIAWVQGYSISWQEIRSDRSWRHTHVAETAGKQVIDAGVRLSFSLWDQGSPQLACIFPLQQTNQDATHRCLQKLTQTVSQTCPEASLTYITLTGHAKWSC